MSDSKAIKVLFGTMTGNSEELANDLAEKLAEAGFSAEIEDAAQYDPTRLKDESQVAIIISTWGEGDPPDDAEQFCYDIYDGKAGELPHLRFAVCSLGDSSYDDFCGCGRKVEESLLKAGAKKIIDRADLDVDFEEGYEEWAEKLVGALKAAG
ncbi:MAG: flavodoxin domain-containing protein [Puniceicoccaceae bacterium]